MILATRFTDGVLREHTLALVHLVGCERRRTPRRPPLRLGALLAGLYTLAGGISQVGSVGHHHPAEQLRGGGVDALLDGDDADVALGEVRMDLTPSSKLRLKRSRQTTTMVSFGWTRAMSSSHPGRDIKRPVITSEKMSNPVGEALIDTD